MSYNQYSGNPYGHETVEPVHGSGGYGASDPYGTTAQQQPQRLGPSDVDNFPPAHQQTSVVSQTSDYTQPGAPVNPGTYAGPPAILSNQDFLKRVEGVRSELRQLSANVSEIGSVHQRILSSPDTQSNSQLENLISRTQILNTHIKDQIKQLEIDAQKSGKNTTKDSQIRTLKGSFKSQLEEYQHEEQTYRQRYKEQIARQYRIVNPEATEQEVQQATEANWGDEGVFQSALKSNRSGAANSVLGAVRARHNDIQQIEKTLTELSVLFQQLAEQVDLQEAPVKQIDEETGGVYDNTRDANKQLTKGIASARRARKLKWWCFFIVVLICIIIALAVGLAVGLKNKS